MDAMVAALVGGVAQLQAVIAGQGSGPLFRVRCAFHEEASLWRKSNMTTDRSTAACYERL